MTFDGQRQYKYDAWGKMTQVNRAYRDGSGTLHVGSTTCTMRYDGLGRMIYRKVANSGDWDCGNYYDGWQMIEQRNGSNAPIKQHVWGQRYIDELVQIRINSNPAEQTDCDVRYWACEDANFNVLGIVDANGTLVERYDYTPYGQRTVYGSDLNDNCQSARWESKRVVTGGGTTIEPYSLCDFGHQGLAEMKEVGQKRHVRHRTDDAWFAKWDQPDCTELRAPNTEDGSNIYQSVRGNPVANRDPSGRITWQVNEAICEINAIFSVKPIWKGAWTAKRKATFKERMADAIESTFNANSYHIQPQNITYKDSRGDIQTCPCPNGFKAMTSIVFYENTLDNLFIFPDWQVDVHANPPDETSRSWTWWGIGMLAERDVKNIYGQTVAVHEFGHLLGLRHPDGGLFSGYGYKGKDPWGHEVDGSIDLMGFGMGLRPFYFDTWKNKLNSKYKNRGCGCNYEIK